MKRFALALFLPVFVYPVGVRAQKPFTLEQVLNAPFPTELTAAPAKGRVAWVFNAQGRRNLWVAEPAADGSYKARQITTFSDDDGQDLGQLSWAPDAATLVYTRGGDLEFLDRPFPIRKVRLKVSGKVYGPFRWRPTSPAFWEKATRPQSPQRETVLPFFSRIRCGLQN